MRTLSRGGSMSPHEQLAAAKGFGRYKEEVKRAVRDQDVKATAVDRVLGVWKVEGRMEKGFVDEMYPHLTEAMGGIEIGCEDIARFLLALQDLQDDESFGNKAGLFLNVMIQNSRESSFSIDVQELSGLIDHFGFRNRKDITVLGDLGDYAGDDMAGGRLTVNGNVGDHAGFWMEEGVLHILGSADDNLGSSMQGGLIVVSECCGNDAGDGMTGGEIIIKGDIYGSIGYEMEGGKITVLGDMIRERTRADSYISGTGVGMTGGEIRFEGRCYAIEAPIVHGKIYHKGKLIVDK